MPLVGKRSIKEETESRIFEGHMWEVVCMLVLPLPITGIVPELLNQVLVRLHEREGYVVEAVLLGVG